MAGQAHPRPSPAAFDALAKTYDRDFTCSVLGRMLRERVWRRLAGYAFPGRRVLELACGTGEDAIWLARQGAQVTATDGSAGMVQAAAARVQAAGVTDRVAVAQVSLQQVAAGYFGRRRFEAAFSNFGGLNTIHNRRPLARALARALWAGGRLLLVVMGPVCPWEIFWYLGRGRPAVAFRRFRAGATARVGHTVIPVWYPFAGQLRAEFAPWFRHLHTESLGLWLPPSYLGGLVARWPGLFARLNRLEQATAGLAPGWGDHYLIIFERQ